MKDNSQEVRVTLLSNKPDTLADEQMLIVLRPYILGGICF